MYNFATVQQRRVEAKEQIAALCATILESPEDNLSKLRVWMLIITWEGKYDSFSGIA